MKVTAAVSFARRDGIRVHGRMFVVKAVNQSGLYAEPPELALRSPMFCMS